MSTFDEHAEQAIGLTHDGWQAERAIYLAKIAELRYVNQQLHGQCEYLIARNRDLADELTLLRLDVATWPREELDGD